MPEPEPRLPPLRDVIARHGLNARKSLGQHFLFDLNLTDRIVRAASQFLPPPANDLATGTVIEVGPGPGGLTRSLLAGGARRLVAIEKDTRCLAALAELAQAYPGRLEVREADALSVDMATLCPAPRRIIANLPYNISTALLLRWLTNIAADPAALAGMILMFQSEVADRLTASPRSKAYGRLSVITQWLCHIQPLFTVPARAFTPPPKVDSTVVGLRPRAQPLAEAAMPVLERVTAAAFGQRRKMLRQSLKSLGADAGMLLATAGVPETARAEELDVAAFCALARALAAQTPD
ncbi:MAG TPA: 16S rRNA (adenine(1518)-N(6)/adenine(1519)-N(6))-dimethyltransferase RsmA [Kiloniellales bacterium]